MTNHPNTVYFSTRDELSKVCLDDVIYVSSDGNYITLNIKSNRTVTLLASLQNILQVAATFPHLHFIRIGRRYIINAAYISQVNTLRRSITLVDDNLKETYELTVPKDAVSTLKEQLLKTPHTPIPGFHTTNGNMEAFLMEES